ncbi:helix-turn-helix domain-containing protein [Streptomyces sedi]|uniref:helix-turn-helix domain-containing protein n=1 Tax=Streptomyces sedi TaxID=555059 RepID=UPI001476D9AC|nr:helix-turn-helix domain-containing protein [Streptomyces sedi]
MKTVDGLVAPLGEVCDLSGSTDAGFTQLPDPATALVLRVTPEGEGDLLVVGPRTRASYHTGKPLPVCLRFRLRPGVTRPVLGVPVGELVDRVTPLADLWGAAGARLERRLLGLGGAPELIAGQLAAALRSRLDAHPFQEPSRALLIADAAEILSRRGPARLPDLAHRLSVSERHLRRLLTEDLGLPPKSYARISRVRRALADGRRGDPATLARLAAATGYYDQSHMAAEFRSMVGVPPGAFFAGRLPTPGPC